jgi:hypothetical protein
MISMIRKKISIMIMLTALIIGMIGCAGERVFEGVSEGIGDDSGTKSSATESLNDAFVYVPTYHTLPIEEGVYPEQIKMTDEALYYISAGVTSNESDELYRMPLIDYTRSNVTQAEAMPNENTSPQRIPLSVVKERRIWQYAVLDNGEYLLLTGELDLEAETFTIRLEQFDSSGQQLMVTDVSPEVNEDPENNGVSYMAVDGEGNFYLCGSTQIWLYDKECLYKGKIAVSGFINALETGTDGKVYLLSDDTEHSLLTEINYREQ